MTHLLDTNTCVVYIRGKNLKLRNRVDSSSPADLALCTIVLAELYYGAAKSRDPIAERAKVDALAAPYPCLPFDPVAAGEYARVRLELEARGQMIGANDLLIASIALANGLTVVTHNTAEFGRVPGLVIEDWEV
jgi:tRNA(fMet)-specific endonuclease VapC